MKDLQQLEKTLKFNFKDKNILKTALTHRSYLNEHKETGREQNERMEFLGDAVLEMVVTEHLYSHFTNPEGELTNMRSSLVNSQMLAKLAEDLNLYDYLYMSKGESKDKNDKARRYIMANAFEALIGAIYLDQGMKKVDKFIKKTVLAELEGVLEKQLHIDPKSKFQEKSQEKYGFTPHYKVLEESGPDHNKKFVIGLYIDKDLVATGEGFSKQEAQVAAAAKGLKAKKW